MKTKGTDQPRLWLRSALIAVLLLTGCSDSQPLDDTASNKIPEIHFKIDALAASFKVKLANIDATDPCAALNGAKWACLNLQFSDGNTLLLEGSVQTTASGFCGQAELTAEVDALPTANISNASFELLNDTSSCINTTPIDFNGARIGSSTLTESKLLDDGTTAHTLLFLVDNHINEVAIAAGKARYFHTATPLPSGGVFIAGGNDESGEPTDKNLYFAPQTSTLITTENLRCPRSQHQAAFISSATPPTSLSPAVADKVLIVGGQGNCEGNETRIEVYDPATASMSYLHDDNGNHVGLPQAMINHRLTLLAGSNELLIVGGEDPTTHEPISCAFFSLDLETLQLNNIDVDCTTAQPLADHALFTFEEAGIDFGVALSGINDNQWLDTSYETKIYFYGNDLLDVIPEIGDLANSPRHLATALRLADNLWALVGGRYYDSGGSLLEIRNDLVTVGLQIPFTKQEAATMMQPRFGMEEVMLSDEDNLDNLATHLLVGGGEAESIGSTESSQSSDALEYLLSENGGADLCFLPATATNPADPTGPKKSMRLMQRRFAHTATQLDNGTVFIFGGVDGGLDGTTVGAIATDSDRIVASMEVMPNPAPPTSCP